MHSRIAAPRGQGRRASQRCAVTPALQIVDKGLAESVSLDAQAEWFHSRREAQRWIDLRLLERAGHIRALRRQVMFPLHCPSVSGLVVVTRYTADFAYEEKARVGPSAPWVRVVEDCKGFREREYSLRAKWMRLEYDIEIRET